MELCTSHWVFLSLRPGQRFVNFPSTWWRTPDTRSQNLSPKWKESSVLRQATHQFVLLVAKNVWKQGKFCMVCPAAQQHQTILEQFLTQSFAAASGAVWILYVESWVGFAKHFIPTKIQIDKIHCCIFSYWKMFEIAQLWNINYKFEFELDLACKEYVNCKFRKCNWHLQTRRPTACFWKIFANCKCCLIRQQ